MSESDQRDIELRLELAVRAVREAGELTLKYFQTDRIFVERKSDDSPVTVADRGAERLLRDQIERAFPDDGIIGEEGGESRGKSGYRWILDPIDGTKTFISGVPLYSQLIGVEREGCGVAGIIRIPALDEMVYAGKGLGAWHVRGTQQPRRARVSDKELGNGLFVTSQVDSFQRRDAMAAFHEIERLAYITRTWGDGYGYLLVATGRAEVMIDPVMNVWDAAAIQPVLEEAGGSFTDWRGNPTFSGGDGVGTNALIRDQIIGITSRFARSHRSS